MNREELIQLLDGYEWTNVEFKTAADQLPKNAWDTVCAFANTAGGWLIFGVAETKNGFEITGVNNVEKIQSDFITFMRSGGRLSRQIAFDESKIVIEDKIVLVFYIHEARRQDKPIFLDTNRAFIRKGSTDQKCSPEEISQLMRDAGSTPYDSELLDGLDLEKCLDAATIQWYRKIFQQRNPSEDGSASNTEFLLHWGWFSERGGILRPSRAAILAFGEDAYFRSILSRPVVDCQWINADSSDEIPDQRWYDRLLCEQNLLKTWQRLLDFYMKYADRPFNLQSDTLQRQDLPPDYLAFRESCINLLIHQDYGDQQRTARIYFYRDQTIFWNPGDALVASPDDLLESGDKPLRNPGVVSVFRRIGLSEQAGTGIREIYKAWKKLERIPPEINNDRGRKSFELCLPKKRLLSEEQVWFQSKLGVHLSQEEAAAFAFLCLKKELTFSTVKALVGGGKAAKKVIARLVLQKLAETVGPAETPRLLLAEHLRAQLQPVPSDPIGNESLISDQAPKKQTSLISDQASEERMNQTHWKVLSQCQQPTPLKELQKITGIKHRIFFMERYVEPLIQAGLIEMLYPDRPKHPQQAYRLTSNGQRLLAAHNENDTNQPESEEI